MRATFNQETTQHRCPVFIMGIFLMVYLNKCMLMKTNTMEAALCKEALVEERRSGGKLVSVRCSLFLFWVVGVGG